MNTPIGAVPGDDRPVAHSDIDRSASVATAARGAARSADGMRIGMVSPYSLSMPGGVQSQVLGLARELRGRGHEVRVLGPCDGPPPEPFVMPVGDSLPTSANGSIAPLAPDPSATLRTIQILRAEGFDVVHVHEPLAPGAPIATVTLQAAPMVGTFHAAGRSAMYRFFGPALARLARRIDVSVAVSDDARDLVQRYVGGDYTVLWNGVETERIRSVNPLPTSRPAIMFLGRHEERKGLEVLLQAFEMIDHDVSLWVAGDGPDTGRLRQRYGSDGRIEWLGRISEEDKIARLRGATVFCAPSLHGESFGVVLIEAMAAATTVVASALAGYQNVATDERDALLVPPGDPRALAAALARVIADDGLADRLVDGGNIRADQLSMAGLAAAYEHLYRQLAA